MIRSRNYRKSAGYTLLELVVSIGAAAVLLAGMTSAIHIALRASDPGASSDALAGHAALTGMNGELQYALTVIEYTPRSVAFTVADRDSDTSPETIRYAWAGTIGDPLTRQYNGGAASPVAEDVHLFALEYHRPDGWIEYVNTSLQIGDNTATRIDTAIGLVNRP